MGKEKILLFIVILILLFGSLFLNLTKPNKAKEAMHGIYDPTEMMELNGYVTEVINDTSFYFQSSKSIKIPVVLKETPKDNLTISWLHDIYLFGSFGMDGVFRADKYRIGYFTFFKYVFSFIGLIIFLILFFKEWKITFTGLEARQK